MRVTREKHHGNTLVSETDGRDTGMAAERLLKPAEVARIVGLSRTAVYRAIERGELGASRLCGRLRVEPAEVEAWKLRTRVQPRSSEPPMLQPGRRSPVPVPAATFRSQLDAMRGGGG